MCVLDCGTAVLNEWNSETALFKDRASTSGCVNDPNSFCYIRCYAMKKNWYFAYFKIKLGIQDKKWSPNVVCKTCAENLRERFKGIRLSVPFGIPMVWHEAQNHYNDCCFCLCTISGYNNKTRRAFSIHVCHWP